MATANIQAVITADDRASKTIKGFGENVEKSSDEAAKGLRNAGLAVAALGVGLTLAAKNATDFTVDLVKGARTIARETGSTEVEASRLLFVTNRLGISAEEASRSFGIFSKNIKESNEVTAEAAFQHKDLQNKIKTTEIRIAELTKKKQEEGDETGKLTAQIEDLNLSLEDYKRQLNEATGPLQKIGVATKTAEGNIRPFNDVLLDVADKFKTLPNGAEKTALAMELFGRSGKDMIKFLNLGSDGIKDLEKRADELGLTLNAKTIASVGNYIESQKRLKEVTDASKIAIAELTLPVLTQFQTGMASAVKWLNSSQNPLRDLTAKFIAFGGPVLTASGSVVAFGANLATMAGGSTKAALAMGGMAAAAAPLSMAITFLTQKFSQAINAFGALSMQAVTLQGALGVLAGPMTFMTTAVGYVTAALTGQNQAVQAVTMSQNSLKISTDNLNSANLSAQQASLAREQAEVNLTNAINQFGASSLEARTAANQLEIAKENEKKASERAGAAANDHAKKEYEAEMAMQAAGRAADTNSGKVGGLAGAFNAVTGAIQGALNKLINWNETGVRQKSTGAGGGGGSFQHGGFTSGRKPITVGEAGQEVFQPLGSGNITPNHELGNNSLVFNVNIGLYAGSPMERRKIAQTLFRDLKDVASSKGMNLSAMMDRP